MSKEEPEMEVHKPVMVREVLEELHIEKNKKYIDATVGAGGHSMEIVRAGGLVLGIDADKKMLEIAKRRLGEKARLVGGNFEEIDEIAKREGFSQVSGVLFDLGVSSVHFDNDERGFSFDDGEALLDMRLNTEAQVVTAADLLNKLRQDQLVEMFGEVMARGESKKMARLVGETREKRKFRRVGDLTEIIGGQRRGRIHPATKAFLALRIAVNTELDDLREALPKALSLLEPGGKLVVISFHSGEERIVKNKFLDWEKRGWGEMVGRGLIRPTGEEIEGNPRARSAKMRVFKKNEESKK